MSNSFRKGIVICPEDFNGFDWPEKMKAIGLNTLGLHSGPGKGVGMIEKLRFTINADFKDRVRNLGLDFEYELHAGSFLMPRNMFETHPEWFAFERRGKKRMADYNWCASSAGAWTEVCANVKQAAGILAPSTHRYFFWGDDAGEWCHCEKCCALSDSDQELLASNKFAAALPEIDREARVAFLAYHKTFELPEKIKPGENVFLEFAPMHRCYLHAITDGKCSINKKCWERLLEFREIFPPEKIHVLEYWLDSSFASRWTRPAKKPYFDKKITASDLKEYYRLGIRSITTFAASMDGEYFASHGERELLDYAELLNSL